MTPALYPPGYEMQVAVQEFCKLCKPKINKCKVEYSATANLILQLWLKHIKVYVEDQNIMLREANQLIKDFTADCTHDVEFYVGIFAEQQQIFEGLIQLLKMPFSMGRM